MNRRHFLTASLAALLVRPAVAADWPTRPVTVVVPFAAGGPTDVQARLVVDQLSARLSQPFVIENRAGAGGNVGAQAVARAQPDGYTLLAGTVGTHAINEFLYNKTGYDSVKDFVPVAMIGSGPNVLIVNPDVAGIQTLQELIDFAKKNPGKLSYGSPGAGTSNHLAMELFKARAGVEITMVGYRGAGPALNDVVAGHVQLMFNGIDNALPMILAGKVKPIAISSRQRAPLLPNVPTLVESAFSDFETASWTAMFAPAGTPMAIVERLNRLTIEVIGAGKVAERYRELGLVAPPLSVADMRAFIEAERRRWSEAVRLANVKLD